MISFVVTYTIYPIIFMLSSIFDNFVFAPFGGKKRSRDSEANTFSASLSFFQLGVSTMLDTSFAKDT